MGVTVVVGVTVVIGCYCCHWLLLLSLGVTVIVFYTKILESPLGVTVVVGVTVVIGCYCCNWGKSNEIQ